MLVLSSLNNKLPALFLQDSVPLDKNTFRVNASYAKHVNPSLRDLGMMFGKAVDNKLSVIAGSVDNVGQTQGSKVVSFLAKGNTISRSLESVEDKMTLIEANVFLDNEDQTLWKLEGSGKHRRLVQSSEENLDDLLQSRLTRRAGAMITASTVPFNHGIRPDVFDFVMYYDVTAGDFDYGFALPVGDEVIVASYKDNSILKSTSPLAIVDAANLMRQANGVVPSNIVRHMAEGKRIIASPLTDAVLDPTEGDFSKPMANNFLTYMSSLYKGTNFFDTLTKLIQERRRIAKENAPLTTMKA